MAGIDKEESGEVEYLINKDILSKLGLDVETKPVLGNAWSGEIKSDNRTWLGRKIDDLSTKYNTSTFGNSAIADILAAITPFGVIHYGSQGDRGGALLSIAPFGAVIKEGKAAVAGAKAGIQGARQIRSLSGEEAKKAVKASTEGIDLVYKHYGDNLARYIRGATKWLRNQYRGAPTIEERLSVPKRIYRENIGAGNTVHDYAFWKDKNSGETIFRINPGAPYPKRSGEKAAAKQMLQELVGSVDDHALRGLSDTEKYLFPERYLSKFNHKMSAAKDIYSRLMSYKAEAGIRSSFEALTEVEAKRLYDIAWNANLFSSAKNSKSMMMEKEAFWRENKRDIMNVFRRVPAILGGAIIGNELLSNDNTNN